MPHKEILGAIAVVLFVISYISYFRGIFLSQVRPHFFTWLIWVISVTIILAAQITEGAGPGAWTTALSAVFCGMVAVYAWRHGEKNFTRGDWISLAIALAAVPVWYATRQAAYAAVISTGIDAIAYYPTFRKSYRKPGEENLLCYGVDSIRHGVSFLALNSVTLATACYPIVIGMTNLVFVAFALWRRRAVRAKMAAES